MRRRIVVILTAAFALAACSTHVEPATDFAIVYGVSDYSPAGDLDRERPRYNDLSFPDYDAEEIAALLRDEGYVVYLRTNDAATRSQLEADFASVASQATPGSRFLFYFAGHGFGDGMLSQYGSLPESWREHFSTHGGGEPDGAGSYTEYLFLHRATPINADVNAALDESISDDRLAELLSTVPSLQQVVVIDACHSGGFLGSGSSVDTVPIAYDGDEEGMSLSDSLGALTLFLDYSSSRTADIDERQAIVIAAAGEQDFSWEKSLYQNGIFTYHFLQAAEHADFDYNGFITASEAYAYTVAAIRSQENESLSGELKFVPRVTGGAVDFVLFRAR